GSTVSLDADDVGVTGSRIALLEQGSVVQLAEGVLKGGQRTAKLPQGRYLGGGSLLQTIKLGGLGRGFCIEQCLDHAVDIHARTATGDCHNPTLRVRFLTHRLLKVNTPPYQACTVPKQAFPTPEPPPWTQPIRSTQRCRSIVHRSPVGPP